MSEQPTALRLADALDAGENFYAESSLWYDRKLSDAVDAAAAELRRLHALNGELLEALKSAERAMSNKRFAAEVLEHDSVVREMIRAAIKKAEGEV
jgi:hypothetical protein